MQSRLADIKKLAHPDNGRVSGMRVLMKAVGITLLAFLLSSLLISPFSASTSMFFSSSEQSNFRFSDIFVQIADGRPVRQLEDRFVLLDVGNADRQEIAEALTMLSLCSPRAVGVDILFGSPSDDDSGLVDALSSFACPVILPRVTEMDSTGRFRVAERSFLEDIPALSSMRYASVNMPTEQGDGRGRVREYTSFFPMDKGDSLLSLPAAMARCIDSEAFDALMRRNSIYGTIDYPSRRFTTLTPDMIADHAADIEGRAVMVGSLSDAYDMHATPVNSYYPGVLIHANALASILDGAWFRTAPSYIDPLAASVICFIIVCLCLTINSGIRGLVLRLLQLVLLYLTVRIGYTLYVDHGIICNFSHTLLMIAFGLFAVDLWNGSCYLWQHAARRLHVARSGKEYITNNNDTEQCEGL